MKIHQLNLHNYLFNYVMLIDDSTIDNFVNLKTIQNAGWAKTVLEFKNPVKALDYLTAMTYKKVRLPQMIFLDLSMPQMSGEEVLVEMEKLWVNHVEKPKVTILSAWIKPTKAEELKAISPLVANCLEKPLLTSKLLALRSQFDATKSLAC